MSRRYSDDTRQLVSPPPSAVKADETISGSIDAHLPTAPRDANETLVARSEMFGTTLVSYFDGAERYGTYSSSLLAQACVVSSTGNILSCMAANNSVSGVSTAGVSGTVSSSIVDLTERPLSEGTAQDGRSVSIHHVESTKDVQSSLQHSSLGESLWDCCFTAAPDDERGSHRTADVSLTGATPYIPAHDIRRISPRPVPTSPNAHTPPSSHGHADAFCSSLPFPTESLSYADARAMQDQHLHYTYDAGLDDIDLLSLSPIAASDAIGRHSPDVVLWGKEAYAATGGGESLQVARTLYTDMLESSQRASSPLPFAASRHRQFHVDGALLSAEEQRASAGDAVVHPREGSGAATASAAACPSGNVLEYVRASIVSGSSTSVSTNWSLEDFDVGRKIGEGRFGKIYLARERRSKCAVVLKCLSKEMLLYKDLLHQVRREVELQAYAGRHHPHVLKLYAYFWDDERIFLVLEYADGGDLHTLRQGRPGKRFEEEEVRGFVHQLASALAFLHQHGILHRDLKPDNVLVHRGRIKLADFSWSVRVVGSTHLPTAEADVPQCQRRRTICGTLDYLSPEQVLHKPYDVKADMWSLGVLCYELLCGYLPFEHVSPTETRALIAEGAVYLPLWLSPNARSFLSSLLCVQEEARFTAKDALAHPFLCCGSSTPPGDLQSLGCLLSSKAKGSTVQGTGRGNLVSGFDAALPSLPTFPRTSSVLAPSLFNLSVSTNSASCPPASVTHARVATSCSSLVSVSSSSDPSLAGDVTTLEVSPDSVSPPPEPLSTPAGCIPEDDGKWGSSRQCTEEYSRSAHGMSCSVGSGSIDLRRACSANSRSLS